MAQFVAARIIRMSRKQRRLTGRVYGNAAYRRIKELDHELYGGSDHGYTEHMTHKGVLDWIVAERRRLEEVEAQKNAHSQDGEGTPQGVAETPEKKAVVQLTAFLLSQIV
jgi:hypothetical protein